LFNFKCVDDQLLNSNRIFLNRDSSIAKLQAESFDLLIIGGGITGAGIALDATTRGLKTALVEKKDFALAPAADPPS